MSEMLGIAQDIEDAYLNGAWVGIAVRDVLRAFNAAEAAAHPVQGVHSAWEIALHLQIWHEAVKRRLAGEMVDYNGAVDWPAPTEMTEHKWAALLDSMDQGHANLVQVVRSMKPEQLDPLVPGKEFTVRTMLRGVPQHDFYHLGQVILLRKVCRASPSSTRPNSG